MRNQESSRARRTNLLRNYMATKLLKLLTDGGFDTNYGRRIAIKANNLEIQNDPTSACKQEPVEQGMFFKDVGEDFDTMMVCKMSTGDAQEHDDVAKALYKMRAGMKAAVDKKVADIMKSMAKKGWRSGMGRIECAPDGLCDMSIGLDDMKLFVNDPGAQPWVLAVASNTWCFGPAEFALPGVAAFVTSLRQRLWISCFLVQPLVEQGLSVQDIKAFLETDSGVAYAKESSVLVHIEAGESVYIPYGVIPVVTYQCEKGQALISVPDFHVWGACRAKAKLVEGLCRHRLWSDLILVDPLG